MVQERAYLLRPCTQCHRDLAKTVDHHGTWTPIYVSAFRLRPSEHAITEECLQRSKDTTSDDPAKSDARRDCPAACGTRR